MDPEVIFILVLILFSMIEGALRKKKGGTHQLPGGAPPSDGRPPPGDLPQRRGGSAQEEPEVTGQTSEGMVPADVWKEIEALARGDVEETLQRRRQKSRKPPPPPVPTPRPPETPQPLPREVSEWRRTPAPPEPEQLSQPATRSREPRPREFRREAALPSAAAVPESASAPRERVALRHRTQKKPKRAPKTEAELHHGFRGPHALRLAFVAREVLGRPLALRDFGEEEFWS